VGTSANALKNADLDRADCAAEAPATEIELRLVVSNLVALVRQQLFVYRDLWVWLNDPFQAPPALVGVHDGQLELGF